MKITFDWLRDHLKTNLKEKNLLEQLTNIGLEVESVQNLSSVNEMFKIAEIIKTEKHPNADRLKVCDVNVGEKELKKGFSPKLVNYWSLIKCVIDGNKNQLKLNGPEIQYDLEEKIKLSSDLPTYNP